MSERIVVGWPAAHRGCAGPVERVKRESRQEMTESNRDCTICHSCRLARIRWSLTEKP